MADVIKRIKTSSGLKQIDYQSLANKNHAGDHAPNGSDPITPDMIGAASKEYVEAALTNVKTEPDFTYGTTDLTPGVSPLEAGKLYFVYEK